MTDVVRCLGRVSELWLDPQNALRAETILALQVSTGYSHRQIELAIENCFQELTLAKLNEFVSVDVTPTQVGARTIVRGLDPGFRRDDVLHILPSNSFTAWVHGAVITLLLGHRCLLKPSSREPVFARAWKKSLESVDAPLSERVQIVTWEEKALEQSGAVVAYGSDETLAEIRAKLPEGMPFVGYGHKLSVGVIFHEAIEDGFSDDLLERVVRDAEPFRLQGCLSPQILFVEDPRLTRWKALESAVDVAPKLRTFEKWPEALAQLEKFAPYLSCVGFAGRPERAAYLTRELRDMDVSRICPLGEMQRPPLSWRNGGIFLPDLLH